VDDYLDYVMTHNFANKTYQEKKAAFERLAEFDGIRPDMPVGDIDRYPHCCKSLRRSAFVLARVKP
jgi:hypothetical protein